MNVDVEFAPIYVPLAAPPESDEFVRLNNACVVDEAIAVPIESASSGAVVPKPTLP